MSATPAEPAVCVCFGVTVEAPQGVPLKLGAFSTCEGLGLEVVLEQREEGGNNGFVWQLPTRVKLSNIKLSRPVCADTAQVMAWLNAVTTRASPTTASVSAMTADGVAVITWALMGVVPVRWSGPSLTVDSPKVAMETLELAHHGFTPGEQVP